MLSLFNFIPLFTDCIWSQIFGDPDAADVVFTSGADVLAVGINVTHQVILTGNPLANSNSFTLVIINLKLYNLLALPLLMNLLIYRLWFSIAFFDNLKICFDVLLQGLICTNNLITHLYFMWLIVMSLFLEELTKVSSQLKF